MSGEERLCWVQAVHAASTTLERMGGGRRGGKDVRNQNKAEVNRIRDTNKDSVC